MLLFELDRKNYSETNSRIFREAVRAIIPADGRLALVKSEKYGFYKFPGGGINEGETHVSALLRETKEETGLSLLPASIRAFGKVREIRRCIYDDKQIFDHVSYYYFAEAGEGISPQDLDDYEITWDYRLEYASPEEAYRVNLKIAEEFDLSFVYREAKVLERLLKENIF